MTFNKKLLVSFLVLAALAGFSYAQADRILRADKLRRGSGLHTLSSTGTSNVVGDNLTQTLTNKTIDADLNTVQDIDNNDIKAAAGIAYSKLSLTTSIVDGDIAGAAAIARSKIATGTASHVVVNDGSGALTSEANLSVSKGGSGAGSFTANNVLLGNGTSAFQVVAPGSSGNVLTSNGTTWQSTAPGGFVSRGAFITNNGTCAISSQHDSFIASVSHPATGQCTLTFTGSYWSAAPICVVSPTSAGDVYMGHTLAAATTTDVTGRVSDHSGVAADADFSIVCVGVR